MNKLVALTVAVLLASSAQAEPRTYTIDGNHTLPRFSYNHMGYSTQLSRFDKTTGTVVYDPQALTASVDVTIDMKSVDTGIPLFDQHIQGADFFDTARYPTATFKSTAVHFADGKPTSIDGDLTIKGVTRPVTLTVTSFQHMMHPMMKKDAIGANATAVIKRSDFNAGKYAPMVSDEVTLTIPLEAFQK